MAHCVESTNPGSQIFVTFVSSIPVPWRGLTVHQRVQYDLRNLESLVEPATYQDPTTGTEFTLRPFMMLPDPFGRPGRSLALCHAYPGGRGAIIPSNSRDVASMTFSDPYVAAAELQFQMEKKYYFRVVAHFQDFDGFGIPYDEIEHRVREASARVGMQLGGDRAVQHVQDGISLADNLSILGCVVKMVAEMFGVEAFDPNMIPGSDGEAVIRIKFSTLGMRNARGYEAAKLAVHRLEMMDDLSGAGNREYKIIPYYDAPIEGDDGNAKPSGFVIDVKMPQSLEMMDPYILTSTIANTVLLWKPTIPEILTAKSQNNSFLRVVRSIWNKLKRFLTFSSIDEQVLPL